MIKNNHSLIIVFSDLGYLCQLYSYIFPRVGDIYIYIYRNNKIETKNMTYFS